jgi:hypothetical protein
MAPTRFQLLAVARNLLAARARASGKQLDPAKLEKVLGTFERTMAQEPAASAVARATGDLDDSLVRAIKTSLGIALFTNGAADSPLW